MASNFGKERKSRLPTIISMISTGIILSRSERHGAVDMFIDMFWKSVGCPLVPPLKERAFRCSASNFAALPDSGAQIARDAADRSHVD